MLKHFIYLGLIAMLLSCSSDKRKSSKNPSNPMVEEELVQQEQRDIEKNTEIVSEDYAEPEFHTPETKDEEEIHFTELWIWEYLNEAGEWEELWIYREPKKNFWLFERSSSFGMTNEMCEWVLAKPNGDYWFSYQEPEMNTPNTFQKKQLEFEKTETFSELWKSTGRKKDFGNPVHGWPKFKGEEYEVSYKGQRNPSTFYLAKENIDLTPVYYFNLLEGDIQLPIMFPTDIPSGFIILSEETDFEMQDLAIQYRFKEITPNSYYAYLPK